MEKIYIIHCATFTDRKEHILRELQHSSLSDTPTEWITLFDKDEITESQAKLFVHYYNRSTMSLHLKWNHVFERIAAGQEQHVTVFEDDVILTDSFKDKLQMYLRELPEDYDMLFLGDGCNLHIKNTEPGKHVYLHPGSRCSDSIVIRRECAEKLCTYLQSTDVVIHLPIDLWLNYIIPALNLKVYWAEPTLVTQGSQNGTFRSSLEGCHTR